MKRNRIFLQKSGYGRNVEDDDDDECALEVVDISHGKFFGKSKARSRRPNLSSSRKQKKLLKLRVPANADAHSSTHQLTMAQATRKAAIIPVRQGPSCRPDGNDGGDISNNDDGLHVGSEVTAAAPSHARNNENSDSDSNYADEDLEFGRLEEDQDTNEDDIINFLDTYIIQLQRLSGVIPLNALLTEFLIPDFVFRRSDISSFKFYVIERRCISFSNQDVCWLYGCQCNNSRKQFVASLPFNFKSTVEELNERYPPCIHISAGSAVLEDFDRINDITPQEVFADLDQERAQDRIEVLVLPFDNSKLCIRDAASVGVVGIQASVLGCFVCKFGSRNCSHVQSLRELITANDESLPDAAYDLFEMSQNETKSAETVYSLKPTSRERIDFDIPKTVAKVISDGYINHLAMEGSILVLDSGELSCLHCGAELRIAEGRKVPLFIRTNILECKVLNRQCPTCQRIVLYDGGREGILNMGNFMVGHDVLRDYMYHFLLGNSCTLHGYYSIWSAHQMDNGNEDFCKRLKYNHWRMSWYGYISLLNINFGTGWQTCTECGNSPDIVVCDGTSLGFKRNLLKHSEENSLRRERTWQRTSLFKDRIAVAKKDTRRIFEKRVKYLKGGSTPLTEEEQRKLSTSLQSEHPAIEKLMEWLNAAYRNNVPAEIVTFLDCLSSSSPVLSYTGSSCGANHLLADLCSENLKENISLWQRIHFDLPLFFKILVKLGVSTFPKEWEDLFKYLQEKSDQPYLTGRRFDGPVVRNQEDPYSFFPTLPKYRERGFFSMDSEAITSDEKPCRKTHRGHPTLLPGIFTVYCPHGFDYGFKVMESNESPNVPFTVFRTRFQNAPNTIIYDNCCNLHNYCLNRDPVHFQNTKFLVDRFHWKNHVGCCQAYNISNYPEYEGLNSQVNEQQNSTLKKLRSQLSYMGQDSFMAHCKLFFWYRNRLAAKKMSQASS